VCREGAGGIAEEVGALSEGPSRSPAPTVHERKLDRSRMPIHGFHAHIYYDTATRDVAARVPDALVRAMAREFGSTPADLIVAVGPSIGACCYEVGADVRDAFGAAFGDRDLTRWFFDEPQPTAANPSMPGVARTRRPNHWFFDGWQAARDQVEDTGVPAAQIHVAQLCTASHATLFCSYRRDGKAAGRMAAAIACRRRPLG